jgi:peptidyl-tRNA hydrolase
MERALELRMYVLVNSTARMRAGKIAAQVGHVVQMVTEYMVRNRHAEWRQYVNHRMHPKIVLKATQEQMEDILDRYKRRNAHIWCVGVHDAGRTQVAPDTLTALAFCPMTEADRPDELKMMKLL